MTVARIPDTNATLAERLEFDTMISEEEAREKILETDSDHCRRGGLRLRMLSIVLRRKIIFARFAAADFRQLGRWTVTR